MTNGIKEYTTMYFSMMPFVAIFMCEYDGTVYMTDLKSVVLWTSEFESPYSHHLIIKITKSNLYRINN